MKGVQPFHQRMAELWTFGKNRRLTQAERNELDICMDANANYVWKQIQLENLSMIAAMTHDHEWQHDICARLEEAE